LTSSKKLWLLKEGIKIIMPKKNDEIKLKKKIEELLEKYPDVPIEIYDIEASEEMAEMYYDEFGY